MKNVNSCCFVSPIREVKPIPGADNIEQGTIEGWSCIIKKGEYKEGDLVIVATTDAVIPQALSDSMQVTNYLRKGQRVRTVKLRGVYSECLIIPLRFSPNPDKCVEGMDMMDEMGITKWDPPVTQLRLSSGRKVRYQKNPNFHVYYKFPNIKNVPTMFKETDEVQITRKIHGTNARYGIARKIKLSLWDRVKKFFGIADEWVEYEYVYGSHNVEKGSDSQGFYDTDVWMEIAEKYNLKEKLWNVFRASKSLDNLKNGITIYGEIYGPGIQKNYDYGLEEISLVIFDITLDGKYIEPSRTLHWCNNILMLPHVEVLYDGTWSKEVQDKYVFDFINGTKIPHEGVVIKHSTGERSLVAKVINPDYTIYSEKHDVGDSH